MKFNTNSIMAIFLVIGLSGCGMNQPRLPEHWQRPDTGPSVLVKSYKMSVGDQIQINVWKNPELSLSEPIRPDGKISMPLTGDVMAVGRTPEELAKEIEKLLASYIKSPNVTVILTNLRGHEFLSRIRVTGSVAKNTSMSYHQGMTMLDAVLEAGGVDIYADSNHTKLHRRSTEGSLTYDIRLEDMMQQGDMQTNILLLPGDIITVPERRF